MCRILRGTRWCSCQWGEGYVFAVVGLNCCILLVCTAALCSVALLHCCSALLCSAASLPWDDNQRIPTRASPVGGIGNWEDKGDGFGRGWFIYGKLGRGELEGERSEKKKSCLFTMKKFFFFFAFLIRAFCVRRKRRVFPMHACVCYGGFKGWWWETVGGVVRKCGTRVACKIELELGFGIGIGDWRLEIGLQMLM